jgi:D-lyxose ketol-isomerase
MTQKEKLVELIEDSINKWDFYLYHFDDERLCDVVDFSNYEFREVGKWCFELWGGKPKIEGLKTIYSEKSHTLTTSKTHPMNYYLNKEKNKYCNLSVQD